MEKTTIKTLGGLTKDYYNNAAFGAMSLAAIVYACKARGHTLDCLIDDIRRIYNRHDKVAIIKMINYEKHD